MADSPALTELPVMETFTSIQGEGFHQGKLSFFIRLAGCDVGCSWCDVKESWDISMEQYRSISSITNEAGQSPAEIVIITGGEPLMHNLDELCHSLHSVGKRVHIETSGAHEFSGEFDWVCLSPKKFKKALPESYEKANELKVIAVNQKDFEWGEEQAEKVSPDCMLYFQAEWDKKEKIYPFIYSYIAKNPKWRISLQSHKYLELP